jgi:excisionase family DNA binding protein
MTKRGPLRPGWRTVPEAAAYLGISETTVRGQISKGRIAAARVGRDYVIADDEIRRYGRDSRR